jgi:predicted metal-dependent peptidase
MSTDKSNTHLAVNSVDQEKIDNYSITKHLVDFLWNEPFYSRILRSLNKVETEIIPTAGVAEVDGDLTLWWNRKFMAGLTPKQNMGLLKHECLHLVFGHTTDRRKEPHLIWNYGTDLAINSTIPENELPEGGLIPGKPLHVDASIMSQMSNDQVKSFQNLSSVIEQLPRDKTSEFYFNKLMSDPETKKAIEDLNKGDSNGRQFPGIGFDDHDGWESMSEENQAMCSAKIKEILKDAAEEANTRHWGSCSAAIKTEVMRQVSREIKWESLLKRFCGFTNRDERRSSIRRLNKKYPGIHSGHKKIYKPAIAVYVDESGSISNKELEKFYSELDSLSVRTDFYLYKFDTIVDESSAFLWKKKTRPSFKRNLTGGTCFQVVTDHAAKNKSKFDAYIILTDGAAFKPKPARGIRRCWIIVPNQKLGFNHDRPDIVINMK